MPFPIRAATILTHSPTKLSSYLLEHFSHLKSHTCLFSLSTNLPPNDLSVLSDRLSLISRQSVGWLSAPAPEQHKHEVTASSSSSSSPQKWGEVRDEKNNEAKRICLSLAFFDNADVVPFRSEIAGKAPIQVGRWHAMRNDAELETIGDAQGMYNQVEKDGGKVDWEDVWSRNVKGNVVPVELEMVGKDRIESVVFASDNASEGMNYVCLYRLIPNIAPRSIQRTRYPPRFPTTWSSGHLDAVHHRETCDDVPQRQDLL
jgi:hypothetical protein